MDPGFVSLTCVFPVVYSFFWLLGFESKLGGAMCIYMTCMHAHICDESKDISICNLKELEFIQEYSSNSEIFQNF